MEKQDYGDWNAWFAPEFGGNLCRLQWRGHDLLRFPQTPETLDKDRTTYGFPVMFPPGRIADGCFRFARTDYELPVNEPDRNCHLHGLARNRAWQIASRTRDAFAMTLEYGPEQPEFAGFPRPFRMDLAYRFADRKILQHLVVTNTGKEVMPCNPGFHPLFCGPKRVRLGEAGLWETRVPRMLGTGRKIPWREFCPGEWFAPETLPGMTQFEASAERPFAEIEWDFGTLIYRIDPKFRCWCIWNRDAASGFIALEPYGAFAGAMNQPEPEKFGVLALAPGASAEYISLLEIQG